MANWYLCEVTKLNACQLPRGIVRGRKVYCKKMHDSPLTAVLIIGSNWDQIVKLHPLACRQCLRIIRRLNDGQSKKLDLLKIDAEYLSRPKRAATFKRR